jgi:hypothetical protein
MPTPLERARRVAPATLVDCGCVAIPYLDGSGIEIEYCDRHAARTARAMDGNRERALGWSMDVLYLPLLRAFSA